MHSNVFNEISLIISLGAAIALLMRFLRQPLIIGHIITGVLAGPSFLGIIHTDTAFNGLSSMGVALLLFVIGLDLNFGVFWKVGKTVFLTTFVQMGSITLAGAIAASLFNFGLLESLIIGLALAMSSTIIIVKLLNDKKETTRLYAQIAIGILLLQDLVATVARVVLSAKSGSSETSATIQMLAFRGICLAIILYIAGRYIVPMLTTLLEGNKELMLVFALAWGLGFAMVFEKSGFSIETGALFAGVSLANLPYSNEMASRLKPIRDFFIVIFFITLGQAISPEKLSGVLGIALVFSFIALVIKPLVVLTTLGAQGYTKRASFKSAAVMSQISEFSLVFMAAALSFQMVSERASSAVTLTALITFAATTYLFKYDDSLFKLFENKLKFFERKVTRAEQRDAHSHYPVVLFGYQKGGHEFAKTFKSMKRKFVVVDYNPETIEILENQQINYVYGDAADPELLDEINLNKAQLVVSTMTDFETNKYIAHWLEVNNPSAAFICSADNAVQAAELYEEKAAYVMLPFYIGSEKLSSFIKRKGTSKAEFKHFREKHLAYLQTHMEAMGIEDEKPGVA